MKRIYIGILIGIIGFAISVWRIWDDVSQYERAYHEWEKHELPAMPGLNSSFVIWALIIIISIALIFWGVSAVKHNKY